MPEPPVVRADLLGYLACVAAVALIFFLVARWRRRGRRVLLSLVLYRDEPPTLLAPDVEAMAGRALGGEVSHERGNLHAGQPSRGAAWLIDRETHLLEILVDLEPPGPPPEDPELAAAFERARSVVALRLIGSARRTPPAATLEMGRLFGELFDAHCVVIARPRDAALLVVDDELRARLRRPAPVTTFLSLAGVPAPVPAGEPTVRAAAEEARRRWPEFEAALADRRPGDVLAVKAPVGGGKDALLHWVEVDGIEGDTIRGRPRRAPTNAPPEGARPVEVPRAAVVDWVVMREGRADRGGFTEAAVSRWVEEAARPAGDGGGRDD